jgi:hypothetical protein
MEEFELDELCFELDKYSEEINRTMNYKKELIDVCYKIFPSHVYNLQF